MEELDYKVCEKSITASGGMQLLHIPRHISYPDVRGIADSKLDCIRVETH